MDAWTFTPIGFIRSPRRYRYDAPRQGSLDDAVEAELLLERGRNFEQAIEDLRGFERIWLLYAFHLNEGWRPRVRVPRHREDSVGVFATRAPYRPNPIGLSCVRLMDVDGLTLRLGDCDLLDGTPVFDIKPYLPYADSFPDAATGWVPKEEELYAVVCDPPAERQLAWLAARDTDILPFARTQLEAAPREGRRKRITAVPDVPDAYILAYRTWRLAFTVLEEERTVRLTRVFSGYAPEELASGDDRYGDKELHLAFAATFPGDA